MVNGFDIGAGTVLLASGTWSFFRGLTREVMSVLGLVAAIALGGWGAPLIAASLTPLIASLWLRQTIGFTAVFLAVVIAYVLFARIVCRMVNAVGLSLPDGILGGLFGILKAAVLIALLLIVLTRYAPATASRLTTDSQLAPHLFKVADVLTTLLPAALYTDFDRFYNRFQRLRQGRQPLKIPLTGLRSPPNAATPQAAPAPGAPAEISPQDEQALRQILQNLERTRDP